MNVSTAIMKICTIGLGYIGLPTSIMFSKYGCEVTGVDLNKNTIDVLNDGKLHIEEPGLQDALTEVLTKGKFHASLKPVEADVFIIAVPTPNLDDEYKSCDLSYVKSAVNSIIPYVKKGNTIIIESTIAPRSMDEIAEMFIAHDFTIGEDVFLVHCPERVLPGKIMHELVYNNRIVGGVTPQCAEAGAKVYETFVKGEIIKTNSRTAEMSKLMENTYRDVNIALANELSKICNKLEIDVNDVIEMANMHPRVNIHTPGPGVGGHCLAVDPYFIVSKAPELSPLISLSRQINTSMPEYVVANVESILSKFDGKVITVFGLAYKGNVGDIRESPAMDIYELLSSKKVYEVRAYDPYVNESFVEKDMEKALKDSELILVLTDHKEFMDLELSELDGMRNPMIFDTKNVVKETSSWATLITYGNIFKYNR